MSNRPTTPNTPFTPSAFMRGRRPHLFSDTSLETAPALAREVFEYHLDSLTSRKEETTFEHFARRLCEKEICPNLLPQTGPTGGGDSKVDTETYAVSDEIAQTWYTGIDQRAAHERWAFAFSAKKDWKTKIKSDVDKIVKTGRGYVRIFFVTNQFVADKKRAETEDELSKTHEVPVQILDRTWIVEKVFANDRIPLAIETLGLTGLASQKRTVSGPRDVEREEELRLLDSQIEDVPRYAGVHYQLAEDCLQAALLARGLGRPRTEVEGRFDRAQRTASKVDHQQQRLRILYARAWTVLWWYDDFEEFNKLYGHVEELAKDTEQAEDAELLFNLWQVLRSSVLQNALTAEASQIQSRTETLRATLDRLSGNADRPNNAAIASTNRLLVDLVEAMGDEERTAQVLQGLKEVAMSSERLANYPIETLSEMLAEIGDVFAGNTVFDDLFESVTEIVARRRSDGQAGDAYLRRGAQKLKADLPYEAIRYFGRAQHKLAKREYRSELVRALVGASAAYEEVGLLWAARSSLITAAHYAVSEFYEAGHIIAPTVAIVERLVWLELRIGRVPCVLAWSELADVVSRNLEASEGPRDGAKDARKLRDIVIGILLMRSTLEQLRNLDFLVVQLQRLDLEQASMSLMYALGHEERMRKDGWVPAEESAADLLEFFCRMLKHDAASYVAQQPEFLYDEEVTLRTNVLGCRVSVVVENELGSLYLAEALLGSLEAFLATSLNERIFPYRETFTVSIQSTADTLSVPKREDVATDHMRISHSIPAHGDSMESQSAYSDWMMETVLHVLAKIAVIGDMETYIEKIVRDERGFERSINNAHVATIVTNIMGANPKLRLADWRKRTEDDLFPLMRTRLWNSDCPGVEPASEEQAPVEPTFGKGEPPAELLDRESGKHGEVRISSVIDIPLWDKAIWCATFFGVTDNRSPPLFGLAFRNKDAAAAIFAGWRRRFGEVDANEELRITVLTGIYKTNPAAYRVVVGSKLPRAKDHQRLVIAVRSNTMTPNDSKNLNLFLDAFAKVGRYVLLPALWFDEGTVPELMLDHWIGKTELTVRPAWEVGDNEPDMMALRPDDDPILPPGMEESASVLAALARIRAMKRE